MEYVKTIHSVVAAGASAGAGAGQLNITVKLDSNSFPIAPSPPSWEKVSKEELEKTYRSYITQHYRASFQYADFPF